MTRKLTKKEDAIDALNRGRSLESKWGSSIFSEFLQIFVDFRDFSWILSDFGAVNVIFGSCDQKTRPFSLQIYFQTWYGNFIENFALF